MDILPFFPLLLVCIFRFSIMSNGAFFKKKKQWKKLILVRWEAWLSFLRFSPAPEFCEGGRKEWGEEGAGATPWLGSLGSQASPSTWASPASLAPSCCYSSLAFGLILTHSPDIISKEFLFNHSATWRILQKLQFHQVSGDRWLKLASPEVPLIPSCPHGCCWWA